MTYCEKLDELRQQVIDELLHQCPTRHDWVDLINPDDEDDMEKFVEGHIEAFEVRIYYKGEKYLVTKYFDEKYYKLLEPQS